MLIDKTEAAYHRCWRILCHMKIPEEQGLSTDELLGFQPTLSKALFSLDEMYRALRQEERAIVGKKASLSPKWFSHRLGVLHSYQETLATAIAIGKSLGDSFAWFFYYRSRELLYEHMKLDKQLHTPPATGGTGEREFIDKVRVFQNHFVLYHGITTFLRLGDVSLIDTGTLETVGIGELKTRRTGPDTVEITMLALGPDRRGSRLFEQPREREEPQTTDDFFTLDWLSPGMKQKLKRQVDGMFASFQPPDPDFATSMRIDSHQAELAALSNRLITSSPVFQKIGDGLLLVACLRPQRSLCSRLMGASTIDWQKKLDRACEEVRRILDQDRVDNLLFTIPLHNPEPDYQLTYGMIPLFWWPLNLDFVEKVLFHKVWLVGMYNPIHLFRKLGVLGFDAEYDGEHRRYQVTKPYGEGVLVIENFGYFVHLITHQLFTEESVVQMITHYLSTIEEPSIPANSRVQFSIIQHLTEWR